MAEQTAARVVGIDLGTTNSLVAFMQGDQPTIIPGEDGDRLVPSVVAFDQERAHAVLGKQQRSGEADRTAAGNENGDVEHLFSLFFFVCSCLPAFA